MTTKLGKEVVIDSIQLEAGENENGTQVIVIDWSSNIGWGQYTLYKNQDEQVWKGESETMDSNEKKEFLQILLNKFIESVEVVE